MRVSELISELCKLEGKKKQVDRAQMAETIKHLAILLTTEFQAKLNPTNPIEAMIAVNLPEIKFIETYLQLIELGLKHLEKPKKKTTKKKTKSKKPTRGKK